MLVLPLLVVALTSLGAYWLGVRGLALPPERVWPALARALEACGLALVFLVGNVIVGAGIVLVARRGLSLYFVDDTVIALSILQALAFQAWTRPDRSAS